MRTISIAEITIDDADRLLVVPELPDGEDLGLIYRAAMEIGWEEKSRALISPTPRPGGWSHCEWFRQTLAAVAQEYGANLVIAAGTRWMVPDELRAEIQEAHGTNVRRA